jgi:hypothetical protein
MNFDLLRSNGFRVQNGKLSYLQAVVIKLVIIQALTNVDQLKFAHKAYETFN